MSLFEGAHQNYAKNGIKPLKISEGAHFHEGAHAHTKFVAIPSAPLCPAQTPCGGKINLRKEVAQCCDRFLCVNAGVSWAGEASAEPLSRCVYPFNRGVFAIRGSAGASPSRRSAMPSARVGEP
jgi:hypothetical protein